MTDLLILILSTDWFLPFWSYIGIETEDLTAIAVKNSCREIIGEITDSLEHYYDSDLSPQRRQRTFLRFTDRLEGLKVREAFSNATSEWANMTHDELTASWIFTRLTTDLISGNGGDGRPNLDRAIITAVKAAHEMAEDEEPEFLNLCLTSRTPWDRNTRNLQPGLPTMLADTLISLRRERRLKMIWSAVVPKLSEDQRGLLITWYHDMARFRGMRYNRVPDFIK